MTSRSATMILVLASTGCMEQPPAAPAAPAESPPIMHITQVAAAQLKNRQVTLGLPDPCWVRFTAPPSGESAGPMYQIEFTTSGARSSDYSFNAGGILCLVPKDQVDLLTDTIVDAEQREDQMGFVITNPNLGGGVPIFMPVPE